jgi:glycosyltransferase involved in cell wall biosynthesis
MHEPGCGLAKPQGRRVNGVGMPSSFQPSGQPGVRADSLFEGGLALPRAHSPLRVVWTTSRGLTGARGMDRLTQLVAHTIQSDPLKSTRFMPLTTRGRWGLCVGVFVFAFALVRFALLAKGRGVDVLQINVAAYGSAHAKMILARLAHWLRVPYIVHIHAGKFADFCTGAPVPVAVAIERFLTRSAAIMVLGRTAAHTLTERLPALRDKVKIVYNATPSRRSRLPELAASAQVQITGLGPLGASKNTAGLISALARLADRSDWVATIAGDGEVAKARAQVKDLGLAGRVAIPGWIDEHAVQALFERTGIFVLPSRSEGLPMAILEAFSYGIAVVATPVNAVADVVQHERNGLLVPVGDLEALVAAISRLLDDADLRHRLGRQAFRDHKAHFTFEAYMRRIHALWQTASVATS